MKTLLATSRTLARLPGLATFLRARIRYALPWRTYEAEAVLAWGHKPSALRAVRLSRELGLPTLRLEEGFLRSIGDGATAAPLSIVVDDLGIYYDALSPSRLEALIAIERSEGARQRASRLIAAWRTARVSKYNQAPESAGLARSLGRYVLVADQTVGDASVKYGNADHESFERMLEAALLENPDCRVAIKLHPDVVAGRKQGYFDLAQLALRERIEILSDDVHPAGLIEHAQAVYVVTSQIGFEALLWGKHVRVFGMPFYAGWGLSQDELPMPQRRHVGMLEDLVHAALIDYARYLDPETGQSCSVERLLEWMALQRKMRSRFPAEVHAFGFSMYKKPVIRRFFQGSTLRFVRARAPLAEGATLAVWGQTQVPEGGNYKLLRLEDGFLRSVGLGADLIEPLSWVIDQDGIYYDATQPSGLEKLLQASTFDQPLLERARALCVRLVAEGLTKYNVGRTPWHPRAAPNQRLLLVPGQVESDAALARATPGIRHNLDLLRAVRIANPAAYLLYKPHPDVSAGLRRAGKDEQDAARWCDEIVVDVAMGELLRQVDEVHTLTSLCGFEALLRGKKVVCYGQPFYAGWGLTADMVPIPRRTRRLSVTELAAAVLILYPTYVSRRTGHFTTPERALEELTAWRKNDSRCSLWRPALRPLLRLASRCRGG